MFAFEPDVATATGGLVALAARLRGHQQADTVIGKIPSTWVTDLLAKRNLEMPVGFLTQASALLSALMSARTKKASDAVCSYYKADLEYLVFPLLMVGVGAPTPHSIEALTLLGGLARYEPAFRCMLAPLDKVFHESPLGFRVWRVVTSMVLAASMSTALPDKDLRRWVQLRLKGAQSARKSSLYPARSLDLELAIAIPPSWTPGSPDEDWAQEVLYARATDKTASMRERGTAAMGLWERALKFETDERRHQALTILAEIAEKLRGEEPTGPREFDSAPPGGREWLIASIERMTSKQDVLIDAWPDDYHPCKSAVASGVTVLDEHPDIENHLRPATTYLFEQTILQNAGVYRRKAIDTLRGAGMAKPVTEALAEALNRSDEPWLRCRINFALGFMQERGPTVEGALLSAYQKAVDGFEEARKSNTLTRDLVNEVHSALFALGDCFGAPDADGSASLIRGELEQAGLWDLVKSCTEPNTFRIPQAAAYLLTVTTQASDLELLDRLKAHPDPLTRKTSAWARKIRFDESGKLRPLHMGTP